MYCEQCGNKISDTAKFCEKCGSRVKRIVQPEEIKADAAKVNEAVSAAEPEVINSEPESEAAIADEVAAAGKEAEAAFKDQGEEKPEEVKTQEAAENAAASENEPEALDKVPESEAAIAEEVAAASKEAEAAFTDQGEEKPVELETQEAAEDAAASADEPEASDKEPEGEAAIADEVAAEGKEAETAFTDQGEEKPAESETQEAAENAAAAENASGFSASEDENKVYGNSVFQNENSAEQISGEKDISSDRRDENKKENHRNKKEDKNNKKSEDKNKKEKSERVSYAAAQESKGAHRFAPDSGQNTMHSSVYVESAARKALGSVWLLLGTIALAAQIILMLFYTFTDNVYEVINFLGRLFFYTDKDLLYTRLAIVIVAAVEILLFLGFLLTFISAKRKKKEFKTAGLTLLQVLCTIGLVLICFAALCAVGAGLVAARYARHYLFVSFEGISTGQIVYFVSMIVCLILLVIFAIIFFSKLISSIGRAKRAAKEGYIRKNIALYNVVILFFVAAVIVAFSVISILTSAPAGAIIIAGELCLALACIFYALFMIKYRTLMHKFLQ